MSWETVIGLEVHLQLATQSKIFSGSATAYCAQGGISKRSALRLSNVIER